MQNQIKVIQGESTKERASFELSNGKHSVVVLISANCVWVVVQNASNKAWRGTGKTFRNISEAMANYKTQAIQDCIKFVAQKYFETLAA